MVIHSHYECYDDIEGMCLEISYQKFLKSQNESHRFVNIRPGWTADLVEMREYNSDKSTMRKFYRGKDQTYKIRPGKGLRFHDFI